MRCNLAIAVGFGLFLAVTNATNAQAQGAVKPLLAQIVNGTANPVPVSVVPQAVTTVACTMLLGVSFSGADGFVQGVGSIRPVTSVQCPPEVTVLDVHRILFSPDFNVSTLSQSSNVSKWRVNVGHSQDLTFSPSEVIAFLTDGAPAAAPTKTFRLDINDPGNIIVEIGASSGIAGLAVSITGAVMFSGTPVQ